MRRGERAAYLMTGAAFTPIASVLFAGSPSLALREAPILLALSGCSHSPTLNLLGSYFPAWMFCAVLGVVAAVIIRQILRFYAGTKKGFERVLECIHS